MNVGFPLFYSDSYNEKKTGVWGDEIVARASCKLFEKSGYNSSVCSIEEAKTKKLDVAVYTAYNMVQPYQLKKISDKSVLWIQGMTYDENLNVIPLGNLYEAVKDTFDIVVTSSRVLAEQKGIPFIVPPVDFDLYYTLKQDYKYDVAYIGNIIKPFETNRQYLNPLRTFNYRISGGDFGKIPHSEWLETVAASKINLHFGFKEGIEYDLVTGRPLFMAACKGFLICDKIPYFMETFRDAFCFTEGGDDEKLRIQYYLAKEEERKKMAERAYEIVRSIKTDTLVKIIGGL